MPRRLVPLKSESAKTVRFRSPISWFDWPNPAVFAQEASGGHHSVDAGARSALTKTLLSESLGPEVAILIQPAKMVMTIDETILAADRRDEWLRRLGELADRAGEAARPGRLMECAH